MALREYGDALQWAQHYGMSADPVRQAQWLESSVTKHAISDYLSKVSNVRWVLSECCRRVPDEPEMIETLLTFGIRKADAEVSVRRQKGIESQIDQTATDADADQPADGAGDGVHAPTCADLHAVCACGVRRLRSTTRASTRTPRRRTRRSPSSMPRLV